MTRFSVLGGVLIIIAILISIPPSLLRREREWRRMQKMSFDDFSKKVQEVTSSMSDEDKLEFYDELLDTGSACVSERVIEHTFSIVDGFEYDVNIFSLEELEKASQETIDDIDYIIGMDDELFDELDDQPDGE